MEEYLLWAGFLPHPFSLYWSHSSSPILLNIASLSFKKVLSVHKTLPETGKLLSILCIEGTYKTTPAFKLCKTLLPHRKQQRLLLPLCSYRAHRQQHICSPKFPIGFLTRSFAYKLWQASWCQCPWITWPNAHTHPQPMPNQAAHSSPFKWLISYSIWSPRQCNEKLQSWVYFSGIALLMLGNTRPAWTYRMATSIQLSQV